MSLRKALLAATMLSLPLAAQAQPVTGLYVGAGAGANWHGKSDDAGLVVRTSDRATRPDFFTENPNGFVGLVNVGWGFGNGLRLEVEGNYRRNDVDTVTLSGLPNPAARSERLVNRSGYIMSYGAMANVLYDIGAAFGWPVHLTVGGGVGYVWHDYDGVGGRTRAQGAANSQIIINDSDAQFAYQGIAGLALPIAAVPGLAVTAEYRYFATLDPGLRGRVTNNITGATANFNYDAENANQSLLLGVRYNFGQAPVRQPPPPAPPPAVETRTFLVFFDWDRADLTARAREIIGQAAQASRSQQTTRLEVAGHADRSGSAQYNQRLSQRRADNVAAELVRQGVSRESIVVTAYGETRPLVPTADGVREPQNRRVEIVLR
jgi:outer membrane protein OmpA-like peptidoglycan-associated protein